MNGENANTADSTNAARSDRFFSPRLSVSAAASTHSTGMTGYSVYPCETTVITGNFR